MLSVHPREEERLLNAGVGQDHFALLDREIRDSLEEMRKLRERVMVTTDPALEWQMLHFSYRYDEVIDGRHSCHGVRRLTKPVKGVGGENGAEP